MNAISYCGVPIYTINQVLVGSALMIKFRVCSPYVVCMTNWSMTQLCSISRMFVLPMICTCSLPSQYLSHGDGRLGELG